MFFCMRQLQIISRLKGDVVCNFADGLWFTFFKAHPSGSVGRGSKRFMMGAGRLVRRHPLRDDVPGDRPVVGEVSGSGRFWLIRHPGKSGRGGWGTGCQGKRGYLTRLFGKSSNVQKR